MPNRNSGCIFADPKGIKFIYILRLGFKRNKIKNYFFLDTTLPTLIKWTTQNNNSNFAIRISSFEDQSLAEKLSGKAQWIWLDCFGAKPPKLEWINRIKDNFKICIVSPELHGAPVETIQEFKFLKSIAHAICTKQVDLWKQ